MSRQHVIYCDIDGTLTLTPDEPNGEPRHALIRRLRDLADAGCVVILWSAMGGEYCAAFADRHRIKAVACLPKPDLLIDDNLGIRPRTSMGVVTPEEFLAKAPEDWVR